MGFNLAYEANKRIKQFIEDCIFKIKKNKSYIILPNSSKIILFMIPMSHSNPLMKYNLEAFVSDPYKIDPIDCTFGRYVKRNFDGLLISCGQTEKNATSYIQIYNNGIIESVENNLIKPTLNRYTGKDNDILHISQIGSALIEAVEKYLKALQELNVGFPIHTFLAL